MIIKRTIGVSAGKALAYDYGPGRAQEHHRPHRVAGTCLGSGWRARAASMDAELRKNGDNQRGSKGRVIRLAVAAAPEDRVLTDREWGRIAERTVNGYTGGRAGEFTWEAVRHDARHIHLTLLQRDHQGRLLNLWRDRSRNLALTARIEREHQLERDLDPERRVARDRARSGEAAAKRRTQQQRARGMQRQRGTLSQQQEREQGGGERAITGHQHEPIQPERGDQAEHEQQRGHNQDRPGGREPREQSRDRGTQAGEQREPQRVTQRDGEPEQSRERGEPVLTSDTDRAYWNALQPHLSAGERQIVARDGLSAAPEYARSRAVADMRHHQERGGADHHLMHEQTNTAVHQQREHDDPQQQGQGRDWDRDRPSPEEFKAMPREQQQAIARQIAEQRRAELATRQHQQREHDHPRGREQGRDDNLGLER